MGLDSDHQSIILVLETTLTPAQRKGKNKDYLVLPFFEKHSTKRLTDQIYTSYVIISKYNAGMIHVLINA